MKLRWVYLIEALVCIVSLLVGYKTGRGSVHSEHYSEGYNAAMVRVVETLAQTDEVRIGNLIIKEPNSIVDLSNTAFFVIDPNLFAVTIDANNTTVMGGHFEGL